MKLGVCYFPEHWPEERWAEDARQMVEIGLTRVRIGEFAWAVIEPEPGTFNFGWLDRAIKTLSQAGLEVILCTPTATPPKWLVDAHPEILAVDAEGRTRGFGSRRHYCFSSPVYRQEAKRIVTALAKRYGDHHAVVMWQTDNEYGCHDTVESYSEAARAAFRNWLIDQYGEIDTLNAAWGTVFWSQTYRDFEEIDPPVGTVTEANPAHVLDYQRFSSDQVVSFNRDQVEILRRLSPGRAITHNFMGGFTAFDHHKLGADLDCATWDSYPLGFLEMSPVQDELKARWLRQGNPDFQAFHHDLYRGCSKRWGVMEQQPGPVNWAPNNPAPLPGMVRLWSLEAIAHGADLVSWFRWRQLPFAQEQMHAGLLRVDGQPAPTFEEARQTARDVAKLAGASTRQGDVALVFDYPGEWTHTIQPQGEGLSLLRQTFETYVALRMLGLDIDILPAGTDLSGYKLVVLPGLPIVSESLVKALEQTEAEVLILPRTGSKTATFQIPQELAPGPLSALAGVKVTRVESLRDGITEAVALDGTDGLMVQRWREDAEVSQTASIRARFADGAPFWVQNGRSHYLAGWPEVFALRAILEKIAEGDGALNPDDLRPLGLDVRLRRLGDLQFAFNYGPDSQSLHGLAPDDAQFVLGGVELPRAGVAAWRL